VLVHQLLSHAAARTPDATAIIEPSRTVTYGQLDGLANRFANVLRESGVRRGDRVVIALENSVEMVAAYFGAMKAGAVAVPLPQGPRSDRLAKAVADCTPAACIVNTATATDTTTFARVPNVFVDSGRRDPRFRPAQLPIGTDLAATLESASPEPVEMPCIDQDLAAIVYTSGSTGLPRGVMLRHRNIIANTESIVTYLELTAADRVMCVLPLYYVYGLSLLHTHMAVGGSLILDNRFAYPNVILEAMRDRQATGFAGVPSNFAVLLRLSSLTEFALPHLRYVTQAGGAMPPARILEWLERGLQAPFYVMYGATEASARLTYLPPALLRGKIGSIGVPIPNTEIVVIKDDGMPAAPFEQGELVARGANVSCGYWNAPQETAERFTPLGYRTGDLGYVDSDGFLYLVGRRDDMMKMGAHRVGAQEIEHVISEYPNVFEVAVVAAPHSVLGEAPVAFVSFRDENWPRPEEVRAFCGTRLPAQKVPTQIVLCAELPKGASGKIDRAGLRLRAAELGDSVPQPHHA
jgi:amino acid adenylation domain-containing protein